jgi:hypothetical protein
MFDKRITFENFQIRLGQIQNPIKSSKKHTKGRLFVD